MLHFISYFIPAFTQVWNEEEPGRKVQKKKKKSCHPPFGSSKKSWMDLLAVGPSLLRSPPVLLLYCLLLSCLVLYLSCLALPRLVLPFLPLVFVFFARCFVSLVPNPNPNPKPNPNP